MCCKVKVNEAFPLEKESKMFSLDEHFHLIGFINEVDEFFRRRLFPVHWKPTKNTNQNLTRAGKKAFNIISYSHGCNFWFEMYFSNFRRRMISAPYFPCVPLSTSKKYAWRLLRTASLLLLKMKHLIGLESLFRKSFKYVCRNIYLGELMLWHGTSRLCPSNSWFRSTIPHGAIPMLTSRPDRCWPSMSKASPTCFVTPDVEHGTTRLKMYDAGFSRQSFTCVCASRKYPSSCCSRGFHQTLPEYLSVNEREKNVWKYVQT